MKFNFYISCENAEEAQQCIKFIDKITSGRKTWEDHLDEKKSEREITVSDRGKKVDNDEGESSSHPTIRPNIDPGEPAIGKIGTETKETLINALRTGVPLTKPEKWVEHYKLLWKRGEVKFDGEHFYL
jgi:hypothetical protein